MKNIYIITSDHEFKAIEGPALQVAEGLRANGARVTIANFFTEDGKQLIQGMLLEKVDLIIGMNPASLNLMLNDKYIHQILKSKFAILFLDDPIYTKEIWAELFLHDFPDDALLLFVDAKQCRRFRQVSQLFFNDRFITQFFPWAGRVSTTKKPIDTEKYYDLVMFSTLDKQIYNNFKDKNALSENFSEEACKLGNINHDKFNPLIIELAVTGFNVDIISIIESESGVEFSIMNENQITLFAEIDSYLKRYRRINVAKSVLKYSAEANLKVGLYGTGWNLLEDIPGNIQVHTPRQYIDQYEIFMSSKALINTDPNWTEGVHDRVFNAFGSNCVAITNKNLYTALNFQDGVDCSIYSHINQIPDKINSALTNYVDIAKNAHRKLFFNHTWKHRCSFFLDYLHYVT